MKNVFSGEYLSLATLKKSGDYVATPVWFSEQGGAFYIFTAGHTGKVKRLRNYKQVRIAPCNYSGDIHGPTFSSIACLLATDEGRRTAHQVLLNKYGWKMRLMDLGAKLVNRFEQREYIQVQWAHEAN